MGLREKVTLILIVFLQITTSISMPRNSRTSKLKSVLHSPKKSLNNILEEYSSTNLNVPNYRNNDAKSVVEKFNFQDVEYPSFKFNNYDFVPLANDYNEGRCSQCIATGYVDPKSQALINKLKREARTKRKYGAIRHINKENIEEYNIPQDPLNSLCSHGAERNILDFIEFPEVEYPLSATDMWASKYKNSMSYSQSRKCPFQNEDVYVAPSRKKKLKKQYLIQPNKITITPTTKEPDNSALNQERCTTNDRKHKSNRKQTNRKSTMKSTSIIKPNATQLLNTEICNSKNKISSDHTVNETIISNIENALAHSADAPSLINNCEHIDFAEIVHFDNPLQMNIAHESGQHLKSVCNISEDFPNDNSSRENILQSVCLSTTATTSNDTNLPQKNTSKKLNDLLFINDLIKEAIRTFTLENYDQQLFDRSIDNETMRRTDNKSSNNSSVQNDSHTSHLVESIDSSMKNTSDPPILNKIIEDDRSSSSDMPLKISLLTPNFLETICTKMETTKNDSSLEKNNVIEINENSYQCEDISIEANLICNIDTNSSAVNNPNDVVQRDLNYLSNNSNSSVKLTIVPYSSSCESFFENLPVNCTVLEDKNCLNYIAQQIIDAPNLKTLILKNPSICNIEKKMTYTPITIFKSLDEKQGPYYIDQNNTVPQIDLVENFAEVYIVKENHNLDLNEIVPKINEGNLSENQLSVTDDYKDTTVELFVYLNSSNINDTESVKSLRQKGNETICDPSSTIIEIIFANETSTNETRTYIQVFDSLNLENKNDLVCKNSDYSIEKSQDNPNPSFGSQNESYVSNTLIELIIDLIFEDDGNLPMEVFIKPYASYVESQNNHNQTVPHNSEIISENRTTFDMYGNNIKLKPNDFKKYEQNVHETSGLVMRNKTIEENDPTNVRKDVYENSSTVVQYFNKTNNNDNLAARLESPHKILTDNFNFVNPTQSPSFSPNTITTEDVTKKEHKIQKDFEPNVRYLDEKQQTASSEIGSDFGSHSTAINNKSVNLPESTVISNGLPIKSIPYTSNNSTSMSKSEPIFQGSRNTANVSRDQLKVKPSSNGKTLNDFEFDPKYEKRIDIHDKSTPKEKFNVVKDPNQNTESQKSPLGAIPDFHRITEDQQRPISSSKTIKDVIYTDPFVQQKMNKNSIINDPPLPNKTETKGKENVPENKILQEPNLNEIDSLYTIPTTRLPSNTVEKINNDSPKIPSNTAKAFPNNKEDAAIMDRNVLISEHNHSKFSEGVPNQMNNTSFDRNIGEDNKSHHDSFNNKQQLTNENSTLQDPPSQLKSKHGTLTNKQIISEYRDHFRNQSKINEFQKINNNKTEHITKVENFTKTSSNELPTKQATAKYSDQFINEPISTKSNKSLSKDESPLKKSVITQNDKNPTELNKDPIKKLTPKQVITQYRDHFRNQSKIEKNQNINNNKTEDVIKAENFTKTYSSDGLSTKQATSEYSNHFTNESNPSKSNTSWTKDEIPLNNSVINQNDNNPTESNKDPIKRLTPKLVITQYRDFFRNQSDPKINDTTSHNQQTTPHQILNKSKDTENINETKDFVNDGHYHKETEYVNGNDFHNAQDDMPENYVYKDEFLEPDAEKTLIVIASSDDGSEEDIQLDDISVTDMPFNSYEIFDDNAIELEIINTITTIHEPDDPKKRAVLNQDSLLPGSTNYLSDKELYTFNNLYRGTESSTKEYTLEDDMLVPAETTKISKPDIIN